MDVLLAGLHCPGNGRTRVWLIGLENNTIHGCQVIMCQPPMSCLATCLSRGPNRALLIGPGPSTCRYSGNDLYAVAAECNYFKFGRFCIGTHVLYKFRLSSFVSVCSTNPRYTDDRYLP